MRHWRGGGGSDVVIPTWTALREFIFPLIFPLRQFVSLNVPFTNYSHLSVIYKYTLIHSVLLLSISQSVVQLPSGKIDAEK